MISIANPFNGTAPVPDSKLLEVYQRAFSVHKHSGQPWIDQAMGELVEMPEFSSYKIILNVTRLENLGVGPVTTSMGAHWNVGTDGASVLQMDDSDNQSKLILTLIWIKF